MKNWATTPAPSACSSASSRKPERQVTTASPPRRNWMNLKPNQSPDNVMLNAVKHLIFILFSAAAANLQAAPQFQSQRALADLERQCAFGPRSPGAEGHAACLEYLAD